MDVTDERPTWSLKAAPRLSVVNAPSLSWKAPTATITTGAPRKTPV
ncbi:MAG: hypothetical protein QOI78_4647 [Actinomycetota bacterium]|jgi:hypothetical protein|nr:hypothetical protein [Actinomycetota bacterium]